MLNYQKRRETLNQDDGKGIHLCGSAILQKSKDFGVKSTSIAVESFTQLPLKVLLATARVNVSTKYHPWKDRQFAKHITNYLILHPRDYFCFNAFPFRHHKDVEVELVPPISKEL